MPELDNYTVNDNTDAPRGGIIGYSQWFSEETLAWACNQRNDCKGFLFHKDRGSGGWLLNNIPATQRQPIRKWAVKKSTGWRKADNPDTSNPSILPRDQMQTRMPAWGTGFAPGGDYSFNTGQTCCGQAGYPACNNMNDYKVPLGWKWMITDASPQNAVSVEGYWDRANNGWDGARYSLDKPAYHAMMDKDDCVLAQNIGFDVEANWDTMENKGVHPSDAAKIKQRWCDANNMTNPKCTPYVRTCPAVTLPCKSRASDITCPAGYDTKDIPNNKCMGYTLQNVAQVNCPTGYTKAAGNSGMCAPNTACTIAPGYQGAGGAC